MPIPKIDLSKATANDLDQIGNEVVKRLATLSGGARAAGYDSHSSSHSKNSVVSDLAKLKGMPGRPAKGGPV
jgi:hypothetical protein